MRKSVKLIATLLIVIGVAPVALSFDSTTTETKLKVWSVVDGLYRMMYKDSDQQNVIIKFVNERNQVLYSEIVPSAGGFLKPFDLTQLPAGEYKFLVETNDGVITESISIASAKEKYGEMVSIKSSESSKQVNVQLDDAIDAELSV